MSAWWQIRADLEAEGKTVSTVITWRTRANDAHVAARQLATWASARVQHDPDGGPTAYTVAVAAVDPVAVVAAAAGISPVDVVVRSNVLRVPKHARLGWDVVVRDLGLAVAVSQSGWTVEATQP